jgi:hypothetical protein
VIAAERLYEDGSRVDRAILLEPAKPRDNSRHTDEEIVRLTDHVGLFCVEWKEDGHAVDRLIFSGPILCNDVMIGDPPKGMIATCVPFCRSCDGDVGT